MKLKVLLIIIIIFFLLMIVVSVDATLKIKKIDFDCDDFDSQKQAQIIFERQPTDIYRLDGDNDGIACEELK